MPRRWTKHNNNIHSPCIPLLRSEFSPNLHFLHRFQVTLRSQTSRFETWIDPGHVLRGPAVNCSLMETNHHGNDDDNGGDEDDDDVVVVVGGDEGRNGEGEGEGEGERGDYDDEYDDE
eukprot:748872-Hanusia_phi.AAC.1